MTAITTVGFPIVSAVGCAWFIASTTKQTREDNKAQIAELREDSLRREERLYQQIDKFSDSIEKFSETLVKIDTRLEDIETSLRVEGKWPK